MSEKYYIDEKTGLYWELKTYGNRRVEYSIEDAYEYADELNTYKHGGFSDWRVPTIDELITLSIIDPYKYNGDYKGWRVWFEGIKDMSNNGFFIIEPLSDNLGKDGWYWSCTKAENGEYYLLNFKEANTNTHLPNQTFYVRCVRG